MSTKKYHIRECRRLNERTTLFQPMFYIQDLKRDSRIPQRPRHSLHSPRAYTYTLVKRVKLGLDLVLEMNLR